MENFLKQVETARAAEEGLKRQLDAQRERVDALLEKEHALRATEASLRGELAAATARGDRLVAELSQANEKLASARTEAAAARGELSALSAAHAELRAKHEKAVADADREREELTDRATVAEGRLRDAGDKMATAEKELSAWADKERTWRAAEAEASSRAARDEDAIAALRGEVATLRASAGASSAAQTDMLVQQSARVHVLERENRELVPLRRALAEARSHITRLQEDVFAGELARRALHNTVQELKGNIRVYVRVRPFLPGDVASSSSSSAGAGDYDATLGFPMQAPAFDGSGSAGSVMSAVACSPDGTSLSIWPPAPRGTKEGHPGMSKREVKPSAFTFDCVFPPRASQADVFGEVSHLVQSALDGYHVCLFSYGQTGSGKSWTMQGAGDGAADTAGLIPRSVKQILETARRLEGQGWKYSLEVSFLEVSHEPRAVLTIRTARCDVMCCDVMQCAACIAPCLLWLVDG